ncbi:hypothetical protein IU421_06725 [Nocardia cyriacigeorgica]|nr:hypothetical protein [Nocardia cyriacigeorgica]
MEMTLTEDWLPKPGELLRFSPTAATLDAVARTGTAPAPATYLQQSHIRRWAERRDGPNPQASELSLVFTVAAPLDRDALRRAFTTFIRRHDTLRSWFDLDTGADGFTLTRHLLAPEDVELEIVDSGSFDSGELLRDELVRRFRDHADPTSWPALVCGAVDHGADGFTLVYSTDHAFSDGLSLVTAIFELHLLYSSYRDGVEPPAVPVGSYVEFAVTERETVAAEPPELDRLTELVTRYAPRVRPLPWDLGLEPGDVADSRGTKTDLLDAAGCERFATVCAAAGRSFSAGLFAAVARTEFDIAGRTGYLGLNVVGTRHDPALQFAQGWFINLLPIAFEVDADTDFGTAVTRAKAAQDSVKTLANIPIHAAIERAAERTGAPMPATTDWPWVSYMDVRSISGAALTAALPGVSDIHGLGSRSKLDRPGPIWFSREHDRLHVTAMFPDTAAASASAQRYLDRLRAVLRAIADTGEFPAPPPGSR